MDKIELLKTALAEGIKILPIDFLKENAIKAKFLGHKNVEDRYTNRCVYVGLYVIEEDELKGTLVYQAARL